MPRPKGTGTGTATEKKQVSPVEKANKIVNRAAKAIHRCGSLDGLNEEAVTKIEGFLNEVLNGAISKMKAPKVQESGKFSL